jgi:FkbM family methyltransferase
MRSNNLVRRVFRRGWRELDRVFAAWRVRELVRHAAKAAPHGDGRIVVFDIGANVGQTATFLHSSLRGLSGVEIHAFEPFIDNYNALRAATSRLRTVRAHNIAFGQTKCEMSVPLAPHSQWHSIANRDAYARGAAKSETIGVTMVDEFCRAEEITHVTLLKTDTEGYDLDVLKGAGGMLERGAIDLVSCEVGFDSRDLQHTFFAGVFDFLANMKYRLCSVDDQIATIAQDRVPTLLYANAWFVRESL